ncbi:MAG TPA: DMT family transporter [Candidatus Eubacterium pullicola]|nr:DMT family transporter [Candidatus Eubacterium pullicola]
MKDRYKVYIGVIMAAFLFGTMEIALKIAGSSIDSFQLTAVRFFIGGLLLLPFAIKEMRDNDIRLDINQFLYLGLVGIICIPVSMLIFQIGVLKSNAATASVLISMNTLFTLIFARIIDNEKISRNKIIAIFVGIVGALFMIKPWDMQEGNTVLGVVLVLIGAAAFGLYTVMGKKATDQVGIFVQTSFSFIEGSIVLAVINLIIGKPIIAGINMDNILPVLYVSVFVTGLGYLFYFIAIKYSNAVTGSVTFFIKPAIAPILAVLILHESIYWNSIVGIILVLIASFVNLRENKK